MSNTERPQANAWDDLVYNLFYPSILGSVIFDYADPMRFSLDNIDRLFLLPALLAFIIDYWHMKNNVRANEGSFFIFRIMDIAVTLLFLFSYYSFSRALTKDGATNSFAPHFGDLLFKGLGFMVAALALVLVYDACRFQRQIFIRIFVSAFVLLAVSSFSWWVHGRCIDATFPLWFRYFSSALTICYAAYVSVWPKTRITRS